MAPPLAALTAVLLVAAPPSLEHAALRFGPAMVAVYAGGERARPGFFVAGSGVAVAVLPADIDDVILEMPTGERRLGRVAARDDDGVCLVQVKKLPKDRVFATLGLGQGAPPAPTRWLLAMGLDDGHAVPRIGGLRRLEPGGRWRLDLPVDAGAPVIVDERVVAVVVERRGKTACTAVPVEHVLALARRL